LEVGWSVVDWNQLDLKNGAWKIAIFLILCYFATMFSACSVFVWNRNFLDVQKMW
jgi:hypothetical protein